MQSQYFSYEDFTKTVLSFSFETLKAPLSIAQRQSALPKKEENLQRYHMNFLPFLLEEARATIASGLEKVDLYTASQLANTGHRRQTSSHLSDAKPFELILQRNAKYPRTEGNPLFMSFKGGVPERIEHGKSMNVILLKTMSMRGLPNRQWLALASENLEGNETYVKLVIPREDYHAFEAYFKKDVKWQAHYLGSVISEQRMYDNCLQMLDIPCIRQIASARLPRVRTEANPQVSVEAENLNLSQKQSLYAFFNAPDHSTLLLQGPPGTGKTTTLVSLLKCVSAQNKRILVSAHSNKGVQVLALRAVQSLPDTPMILIGVEGKVPEELKSIFLNRWYDNIKGCFATYYEDIHQLSENPSARIGITATALLTTLSENLAKARQSLSRYNLLFFQRLDADSKQTIYAICGQDPVTMGEFESLQGMINTLKRQSNHQQKWKELLLGMTRLIEKWERMNRETIESHLLNYSDIVFATLITCGRESLQAMDPVDYLLVDEAAQSTEAATLIPMRFQPKKVLLVGDTKQLPATVISGFLDDQPNPRNNTNYKWSMMWRLIEENQQPSMMLTIQYRMHPHICQWPSEQYYANQLITAPDIISARLPETQGIISRPYAVYHVNGRDESGEFSHSLCNDIEATYVVNMIRIIREQNADKSIGVITPYTAQKSLIIKKLSNKHLQHELIDVNTVDGFQGDERDIIIVSFTRTHVSTFLKEFRRLNVAITRPKLCLIVLASPGLVSYDIGVMMRDAEKRGVLFTEEALKLVLRTKEAPQIALNSTDMMQSAWRGNPDAQFEYSKRFLAQHPAQSMLWLRRASEGLHPAAQFHTSQYYFSGHHDLPRDIQLAIKWLEMSAKQNHPEAQYDLAQKFIQGGIIHMNKEAGLYWCQKAAEGNHILSLLFLARAYRDGRDVGQNHAHAVAYYRRAAQLRDTIAMFELAQLLEGAQGDKDEAIILYRELANLGHQQAYYSLAVLLGDNPESFTWLVKSADSGHQEAQYKVALFYNTQNNLGLTIKYARKAAGTHHQALILLVGILQANPIEMNEQDRRNLYKNAADKGHVASQYFYGLLIMQSEPDGAYAYFNKALSGHYTDAYYHLALLEKKKHLDTKAYQYFKQSIAHGKFILESKRACIAHQIEHHIDWPLCLIFCEELFSLGESAYQFVLARLLDTGIAGTSNKERALGLYIDLSSKNHVLASFYAANLLDHESSTSQELAQARAHYERSHDDVMEAKLRLATLLLQESSELLYAERLLKDYCDNYQVKPNPLTLHLNETERHLEASIERVVKKQDYFIRKPLHSTARIQYYLGKIYEKGLGVKVHAVQALCCYALSAEQNDRDGCYHLGYCYEHGIGTPRNWPSAKMAYQKAANLSHALAAKRLTWQYSIVSSFSEVKDENLVSTTDNQCRIC